MTDKDDIGGFQTRTRDSSVTKDDSIESIQNQGESPFVFTRRNTNSGNNGKK